MRVAFFETLAEMGKDREDIFVLTADLGFKLFDGFNAACPSRFFDVGVAESNMIGLAAGLSLSGKTVYCYSIIPFLVMRPFEQIRMDVAYENLNVRLVGVGGGFTYGLEGISHFGLEDLALMRSLPNMCIVVPADPLEAQCLARLSCGHEGPMYIRLGKTGEPRIHERMPAFHIGKSMVLKEGRHAAIIAVGSMVLAGKQVASLLEKRGIDATLVNMHTIKPLDVEAISHIASTHEAIFTLEEHNITGGLGSAVAEILAETGFGGPFRRFGIDARPRGFIGHADYLKERYGLSPEKIFADIIKIIKDEPR